MRCDYRLEKLADFFCDNLTVRKDDPFIEDVVVTQSRTMELYLNKQLADKKQIAANIKYLYPRNSINAIFKSANLPQTPLQLNADVMVWQIYQQLPALEAKYPVINGYIHHDQSSVFIRRYQLARVISGIFDYYMGYRGDWLEIWQNYETVNRAWNNSNSMLSLGEHEIWQAELWRKLTVEAVEPMRFSRPSRLLRENIDAVKANLPDKLTIFGISNLPADFIDFFAILGEYTTVDFYYLMPCLEYWGDVNRKSALLDKFDNPLLASWATLGRDFFNLLLDRFSYDIGGDELEYSQSAPAGKPSLLAGLQQDILYNTPVNGSALRNLEVDNSIVINSCYSRMREIEVLRDYILDLLQHIKLEISDIVVMAPDIELYIPYIQVAFSQLSATNADDKKAGKALTDEDEIYIPFSIADCSTLQTAIEAETLLKIIAIADSKMLAQDMFDIISSDPVVRKFNFTPDELSSMHDLILRANIAWGKDSEHREKVTNIACHNINTWEFGFKRLLAGYAFDCETTVNDGTLPLPLNGNQAMLLGKLIMVCKLIFKHARILNAEHAPEKWHEILLAIVNEFFHLPKQKNENLNPIYDGINKLFADWQLAALTEPLPLAVVKSALDNEFGQGANSNDSFFRGKLTFCRLLPMRNIPFKSICLIGMNEGEFPRLDKHYGFDLARQEMRQGDRSLRKDDRYIFLETLMASREKLYLSYIGQSHANNETIPPSILISELLDYLSTTTGLEHEAFITKHPLHGFTAEYFTGDSGLFSYSAVNCAAAKALLNDITADDCFCPTPLPLPNEELEFTFADFINFFKAPSKFFLQYCLKINLYNENVDTLRSCEPFELDNLEQYQLKADLLEAKMLNKSIQPETVKTATGDMPYGVWGGGIITEAKNVVKMISPLIDELGRKLDASPVKQLKYNIKGRVVKFSGQFDNLYTAGQAFYRPSNIKNKDKLNAWLWHQLALDVGLDIARTSLIGYQKSKGTPEICQIDSTESRMEELVDIFLQGLCAPLPLFINSSAEFIAKRTGKNPLDIDTSLKVASAKWDQSSDSDYDYDLADDNNRICFGETSPALNKIYQDKFIELAEKVYGAIKM